MFDKLFAKHADLIAAQKAEDAKKIAHPMILPNSISPAPRKHSASGNGQFIHSIHKRNANHDVNAKRQLSKAIVSHQVALLAQDFMLNTDRIDMIEPSDGCVVVRCNQTGMPFMQMPVNIASGVSNPAWEMAYAAPFAIYKTPIDAGEMLRTAPAAYMVQFIMRLCAIPFRSGKTTVVLTTGFDRVAFDKRAAMFDYFSEYDSGNDEMRATFIRAASAAFLLHRVGILGPSGLPYGVADSFKFGEFYNSIISADFNESPIDLDILTSRLCELYALIALHYNPIFYQRNSQDFGITATWADFEQIRSLHNTAITPQIRVPVPSKHERMVSMLGAELDKLRDDGFRFGSGNSSAPNIDN